jgi:rod shape-determining protein MreD
VRGLISFVVVAVAVIVQLTIVDRIAFPGGAGPDVVLLSVAALALAGGPLTGVLVGFWGGLALDVAPPGSHFIGQNALVFCLVGYACGLLADDSSGDSAEQGHSALFEIVVTAAGAVVGEALAALLGVMLSDPRVTWPAITHVLPAAMAYDVLLCPFVLYAVAAALRLAGPRSEGRPVGWSASQVRAPLPGANHGSIRQLAGGNSPRLRLSERDKGSGLRPSTAAFRDGRGAAGSRDGLGAGAPKVRFGGRRREGILGGSLLGGASPSAFAPRGSGSLGSRGSGLGSSSMGRSLLGGSVFSRSSSPLGLSSPLGRSSRSGRPGVFGRPASLGRSSSLRHRGNLMRSAGGGLAGPKSPGRGWLRGASSRSQAGSRSSLGHNSLGRGAFGRRRMGQGFRGFRGLRGWRGTGPPRLKAGPRARLRMPHPKVKRRWRTGGYR